MQLKAERWSVHIDDQEVKPIDEMNGRIVYLNGNCTCSEKISDAAFPQVTRDGVIKLRRCVEMFQWVETKHENTDDDGNVTRTWYTYEQKWADHYQSVTQDESKRNQPFPLPSTIRAEPYRASGMTLAQGDACAEAKHENVKMGAYYLGNYVIRELANWQHTEDISAEQVVVNPSMVSAEGWFSTGKNPFEGGATLKDGHWYFGDRTGEAIGNVRVSFEELKCGPVTICGVLAKTEQGFTFVPILRPDAGASGESIWAELGGGAASCCLRVRELHYEEEDDEDFKERLKDWPMELTQREKKGFRKSKTSTENAEYNPDADLDDLCCVGPFGGKVIELMHYCGLEEEFLGVAEKHIELPQMMKKEGSDAANRHCTARVGGLCGLCIGSLCIISPLTSLLTANMFVAAFGGALLSCVLSCLAMLCSLGCFMCITSCAWLAHRPTMAVPGFMICFCCFFCMYWMMVEAQERSQNTTTQPPNQGFNAGTAFLAFGNLRHMAHRG